MNKTYEVIIVGAGPVGLWLACELRLAGVEVAIIERRLERSPQSRALTIHGRSLELFSLRGLADWFLANGRRIPTGHYAVLDTRLDFSHFETRFPFTLFIPQAATEARLEARARELGVDIRRGVVVTEVEDRGEEVRVLTETGEFTARYVVGADGARSIVREQAGIAYEGPAARNTMILGDVVLSSPPSKPVVSIANEHGLVMIAPLGDGKHHRIVLVDPRRTHVEKTEPVTLEELSEPAALITGEDFGPRDPVWLSRFADETRLAAAYRKGRILLAGDAAHIHAPMGGQGMNVGLQDAMNLGWKLAAVVRGAAPDTLLDTYEKERRPVGQALYANTLAQVGLATHFDPAGLALRAVMNRLLTMPEVNQRLAGELSGFDVAYGAASQAALAEGRLAPGVRVPNAALVIGDATTTDLHELMEGGNWLHLSFKPGATAITDPQGPADRDIRYVAAKPLNGEGMFEDLSALLVRPDGYAAAVARQ
jgi:2-polyprenyl-6-methoxyphenol hydroxylase-like FAD-dependent oxidoreductase